MIVRNREQGYLLIYQQAHAMLAAQLVQHWRTTQRPAWWLETLIAIAGHDNGWQEWVAGEIVMPDGTPRTFLETTNADVYNHARETVAQAVRQSVWTGILAATHMAALHARRGANDPRIASLLEQQAQQREAWQRELDVTQQTVDEAYALLRWADSLSLLLCRGMVQPNGEPRNIAAGPDGTTHQVRARGPQQIAVTPWPYEKDSFATRVDAYAVEGQHFSSSEALREGLFNAPRHPLIWRLEREAP